MCWATDGNLRAFHHTSSSIFMWTDMEERMANLKGGCINTLWVPLLHHFWLHLFYQPTWFNLKHKPQVAKVTLHLVRTIFSLPPFSSGDDLPFFDLCQPTATSHIDRTAKGSQAYLNPFKLCFAWPWVFWGAAGALSVHKEGFLNQLESISPNGKCQ